ncbi:MAG TPA: gamma-glutamyl-gamma-aminobutyrate hydrolase family protein [Chloroflexota bacterium]|nr:gamma-glutamyl-gamma-aminobutyrate hydrolase family protein [Chloroflexota bacterium]
MSISERAPLIGITGHVTETSLGRRVVAAGEAYVDAIRAAGGFPVLLTPTPALDEIHRALGYVDGVLFTGGKDVDPVHYGETVLNTKVAPEPERDAFELPLARAAVDENRPLLAICRGMQVLNVALGGSLWQDIPEQLAGSLHHYQKAPRDETAHAIEVTRDTLVGDLLAISNGKLTTPAPAQANSFHHQAVRDVAGGLVPVAHAPDGLIEAIELPGRDFVVGVQWHPEHLTAHASHRRLFERLVAAARRYRSSRLTDSR